jgi:hypothetical protein
VNKREECRLVVVGDRIFAVVIHARSEASRIDTGVPITDALVDLLAGGA